MGVTIHYRGKLADIAKINVLCDELALIADKMDWAYTRLDEDWLKPMDARFEYKENKTELTGHLPGIQACQPTYIPPNNLLKKSTKGQINPPRMDIPVARPRIINPSKTNGPYRSAVKMMLL